MSYGRSTRITPPTAADYALAAQVANFMETLSEKENCSDYEWNLGIYGKAGMVNTKGLGIVASAVGAYNRELTKKVVRAAAVSKKLGAVKDKLNLRVKLVSCFEKSSDWGVTFIQKFEVVDGADAGARITWFGSNQLGERNPETSCNEAFAPGHVFWLRATVKGHNTYQGIDETIVSHASVSDSPEGLKAAKKAAASAAKAAKAQALIERDEARKAFGAPVVLMEYVNAGGWSADRDERAKLLPAVTRVVQLSVDEFVVEAVNGAWNGGESDGTWVAVKGATYHAAYQAQTAASHFRGSILTPKNYATA